MSVIALLIPLQFVFHMGMATTFKAKEPTNSNGGSLACEHRILNDKKDLVVAHRTLACGTQVEIVNTRNGLSTIATVADRGPYGCVEKKKDGTKKIKHCRKYISVMDIAPRTARMIKHDGKDVIMYKVIVKPAPPVREAKLYVRRNT